MTPIIRAIGIGDLQVVRQQLVGYEAGEVSHIENVLEGELLRRSTTREEVNELTITQETSTSQVEERDLQSTTRNELSTEAQKESSQIRVLWTSPLIPSDPFVWHKDLDPAIKAKLKSFVLGYAKTDAEEKAILGNIYSYGGFRESNNDQLIPIRQLELAKQRAKVETDNALDSAA